MTGTRKKAQTAFAHPAHDHASCIAEALVAARRICRERHLRLTPIRERVLELVWQSHRPVGAYELLDRFDTGKAKGERRTAPPTIYRALEFLTENGLVHRIDSLNAFVGCESPAHNHEACFMICEKCGSAAEFDDAALLAALDEAARRASFSPRRKTVEILGLCPDCDS